MAAPVIAQSNGKHGGVDNCKMCQPDIYNDRAKTAHARSFELLVNAGEEKTPECLGCHSTGNGKGGFVPVATPTRLSAPTAATSATM